jgi:hypothetical protein
MPYDPVYDDEEKRSPQEAGSSRRFQDFDCPECAANNPWDDGFGNGDEIRCFYCGQEFRADVNDSGRLRLKAI